MILSANHFTPSTHIMAQKKREKSATGIYHAIFRGINKQDIFFNEADFMKLQSILQRAPVIHDPMGNYVSKENCQIYAYCILANHCHILIKEGEENISEIMQKIESAYANYYNRTYARIGHLFQGRFKSEPVEDELYLKTAFRYITQNPVKATSLKCTNPEDYAYSSWREYLPGAQPLMDICYKNPILDLIPLEDLIVYVNTSNDDKCLDIDNERLIFSDQDAWQHLAENSNCKNVEQFKQLPFDQQYTYIAQLLPLGMSIRQAARLSALTRYQIEKRTKISANVSETMTEESVRKKVYITKRESRILQILRVNGTPVEDTHQITNTTETPQTLAQALGCSVKTIIREIKQLEEYNLLKRIGRGRHSHWLLSPEQEQL